MGPDTLKLINAVKMHKCLFDTNHQYYRNLKKRADAWVAIGASLNSEKRSCQVKWKTLRDHYVKEYWQQRNQLEDSDADDPPPTPWRWFSHMSFLDEYLKQRTYSRITPPIESLIPEKKIDMRVSTRSHNSNHHNNNNVGHVQIKKEEPFDADEIAPFAAIDIPIDNSNSSYEFENVLAPNEEEEEEVEETIVGVPLKHEPPQSPQTDGCDGIVDGGGGFVGGAGEDTKLTEDLLRLVTAMAERPQAARSKHAGFIQMMEDMLNQMPENEQRNSKMFILNYLHEKTEDVLKKM